jgi:hypothetical protein
MPSAQLTTKKWPAGCADSNTVGLDIFSNFSRARFLGFPNRIWEKNVSISSAQPLPYGTPQGCADGRFYSSFFQNK